MQSWTSGFYGIRGPPVSPDFSPDESCQQLKKFYAECTQIEDGSQ
jgi:hypothetical protein